MFFHKFLGLFASKAPLVPAASIAPTPKIRHATAEGTSRKRWRQMSRSRRRAGWFDTRNLPMHKQEAWQKRCEVRVYRWFKHNDPTKKHPPSHIKLMMQSLGTPVANAIIRHAVEHRSYGH